MDIEGLQVTLREFAEARAWDSFHNPKNLAMALSVEAGELVEIFQWLTDDEAAVVSGNEALKHRVSEELADVMLYLVRLADKTNIDLELAVRQKLVKNAEKYPVDRVYGSAKKYTEY
ncbi:nucleotide pyrophosphohydrolase [Luteibacter aegosomatis]|uniref:nucleotide pyrophosphohydrolase n=1 Tax=Luteibacter aegosomatis TaxID=2911537 RepID=UPI001FFA37DB|nr:nucleotide pyrophosphohydrolase [Luteibacter aegosomatis]UPG86403.1 nucleotide pyrophosphohydrolase [Luteibacter aegosomatis]